MSQLLQHRDLTAETEFLNSIRDLDFLLLQRNWEDETHGDLDLLLSSGQWALFTNRVIEFSNANSYPLAKAYEIETGVICLVLLTPIGRIHLDVALSVPNRLFFGVDTEGALKRRDQTTNFPIAHGVDANTYKRIKRRYKRSTLRKLIKKFRNLSTILVRIRECTIVSRGSLIYVPYVNERDILSSLTVSRHNTSYVQDKLLKRYS